MAEYVVEFGKDGRPVEPDGRLDAPAFHRNHQRYGRCWKNSSPENRATWSRPAAAPASTWVDFARHNARHRLVAKRSQRATSQEHRCVAGACGVNKCPPAVAHRSVRSGLVPQMHDGSGPARPLAVFCANVIHIAPWRIAEGLFAGAGRTLRPDGRLFLYGPFKRAASIPRSAMRCSTQVFASAIPNGACAISRICRRLPAAPAWR